MFNQYFLNFHLVCLFFIRLSVLKKKSEFGTYPRFTKLLSNEFDYKACLLWIIIAVSLVLGLVRLGKYCFERSERRSERYRISQREKVMKEIDDYFARQKNSRQ